MSERYEPSRWTDPASQSAPLLASAVRAIREQNGSAAQVAALAARLQAELAAPSATGDVVPKATSVLSATKLVVLSVLCAAGVGALWHFASEETRTSSLDALATPAPAPVVPGMEPPRPRALDPVPAARPDLEVPQAVTRTGRKELRASGKAQPRARTRFDAESELALLGRAQAVLDREPRAALALTAEHARDYPRGVFAEEREVIALEAELKLGHAGGARARALRFVSAFPRSAHVSRVRSLVEVPPGEPSTDNQSAEPTPTR